MSEYYECHITMRGDKAIIQPLVEKAGWKFSCIDGDPVLGDGILCYATKHYSHNEAKDWVVLCMNRAAEELKECNVIRQKVEFVLYDTKWKSKKAPTEDEIIRAFFVDSIKLLHDTRIKMKEKYPELLGED